MSGEFVAKVDELVMDLESNFVNERGGMQRFFMWILTSKLWHVLDGLNYMQYRSLNLHARRISAPLNPCPPGGTTRMPPS